VIVFDISNMLISTDVAHFLAHIKNTISKQAEFAQSIEWLEKDDDFYEQ